MTLPTLNLDALDAFDNLDSAGEGGRPLQLDINQVHEDPDQPRKSFDTTALAELTDSIRESGVKSPVSVRPHSTLPNNYILNFGARRLRASKAAGLATIPAFVDEAHTDFEQVIENLQRDDLTPMEMAQFIHAKIQNGFKKNIIAQKLGISATAVSKYLALIDAPQDITDIYNSGRCQSPETLYDLRNLYTQWPEETACWLANVADITRASVDTFRKSLKGPIVEASATPKAMLQPEAQTMSETAELEAALIKTSVKDRVSKAKLPVLHVSLNGRHATLLLTERGSSESHLVLQWMDTGERTEVPAKAVRIERLTDDNV